MTKKSEECRARGKKLARPRGRLRTNSEEPKRSGLWRGERELSPEAEVIAQKRQAFGNCPMLPRIPLGGNRQNLESAPLK